MSLSTSPHLIFHQPKNLEEALDLVSLYRTNGKILAGGTDLVPNMNVKNLPDLKHIINLDRVPGISNITYQNDDGLVIGGNTLLNNVAKHQEVLKHYPGLALACSTMATPQVRNIATIAGNIANSSPSADTAAPLLAYNAALILVERGGRRHVPLSNFFTGPNSNILEPSEIIEAIRVPSPPKHSGSSYFRLSARSKVDIAAVGAASFVALDSKYKILKSRLALTSIAPTPLRCYEAENIINGNELTPKIIKQAAASCVRNSKPIDDIRASASYRRKIIYILISKSLQKSYKIATEGNKDEI